MAAWSELPRAMAERFQREHGLPEYDALAATQSKAHAAFFEAATALCRAPKLVANWMMGELARRLNAEGLGIDHSPVGAATLGALITRIGDGTISNNTAKKDVFPAMWAGEHGGDHAGEFSDAGDLEIQRVDEGLARQHQANIAQADECHAGGKR